MRFYIYLIKATADSSTKIPSDVVLYKNTDQQDERRKASMETVEDKLLTTVETTVIPRSETDKPTPVPKKAANSSAPAADSPRASRERAATLGLPVKTGENAGTLSNQTNRPSALSASTSSVHQLRGSVVNLDGSALNLNASTKAPSTPRMPTQMRRRGHVLGMTLTATGTTNSTAHIPDEAHSTEDHSRHPSTINLFSMATPDEWDSPKSKSRVSSALSKKDDMTDRVPNVSVDTTEITSTKISDDKSTGSAMKDADASTNTSTSRFVDVTLSAGKGASQSNLSARPVDGTLAAATFIFQLTDPEGLTMTMASFSTANDSQVVIPTIAINGVADGEVGALSNDHPARNNDRPSEVVNIHIASDDDVQNKGTRSRRASESSKSDTLSLKKLSLGGSLATLKAATLFKSHRSTNSLIMNERGANGTASGRSMNDIGSYRTRSASSANFGPISSSSRKRLSSLGDCSSNNSNNSLGEQVLAKSARHSLSSSRRIGPKSRLGSAKLGFNEDKDVLDNESNDLAVEEENGDEMHLTSDSAETLTVDEALEQQKIADFLRNCYSMFASSRPLLQSHGINYAKRFLPRYGSIGEVFSNYHL